MSASDRRRLRRPNEALARLLAGAYYLFNFGGRDAGFVALDLWRRIYVIAAMTALYLNSFAFVFQGLLKVRASDDFAPTRSELAFLVRQNAVLILFVALGFLVYANSTQSRLRPNRRFVRYSPRDNLIFASNERISP